MRTCARCGKEIKPGQRAIADPCCSAPDCENLADESHFDCLPLALRRIEEQADEEYYE